MCRARSLWVAGDCHALAGRRTEHEQAALTIAGQQIRSSYLFAGSRFVKRSQVSMPWAALSGGDRGSSTFRRGLAGLRPPRARSRSCDLMCAMLLCSGPRKITFSTFARVTETKRWSNRGRAKDACSCTSIILAYYLQKAAPACRSLPFDGSCVNV